MWKKYRRESWIFYHLICTVKKKNFQKEIDSLEIQKITKLLNDLEKEWNNHDLNSTKDYYSDTFVNGDSLNLEDVNNLTRELPCTRPLMVILDPGSSFITPSQ